MSAWNNSTPEERIEKWRNFRNGLGELEDEDLLNSIAHFFASVPIGARCVDFYTPESWPTPWEILYDKLFCTSSISLLIYYTLTITLDEDRATIVLIDTGDDLFLAPLVDKKHIFNIELGKVNNIKEWPSIDIVDDFNDQKIYQVQ